MVMPGDRVGLVGSNGAGKSTLLQCIAGFRPMDEGTCIVKNGARMGEPQLFIPLVAPEYYCVKRTISVTDFWNCFFPMLSLCLS